MRTIRMFRQGWVWLVINIKEVSKVRSSFLLTSQHVMIVSILYARSRSRNFSKRLEEASWPKQQSLLIHHKMAPLLLLHFQELLSRAFAAELLFILTMFLVTSVVVLIDPTTILMFTVELFMIATVGAVLSLGYAGAFDRPPEQANQRRKTKEPVIIKL